MKNKFFSALKNPPILARLIVYFFTIILSVLSVVLVVYDSDKSRFNSVYYVIFGLAGVLLFYTVYLLVKGFPTIRKRTATWLEKHDFTYLLVKNYGFRTVIFTIVSFFGSVIFGAFNGYMGIVNRSIWYGALAGYYVMLALLRSGILLYHSKKIGKKKDEGKAVNKLAEIKIYRNSGIILLVLNVALSTAIIQMIFSNAHFVYVGLTIFAYAMYSFYKITMSIINLVRANKQDDMTIKAITNVNLADASVSILALQTALLTTFNKGEINVSMMNTFTGIIVSAFCIGLGIFMIIRAIKKRKELLKNE